VKVSEWMVSNPVTAKGDDDVQRALELMRRYSIRHLPVVEEGGKLAGLVTLGDLRELMLPSMVERLYLREVMIPDPVTVSPDTEVDDAARTIFEKKIGGLPVVEGGRLVGMITVADLLQAFIEMMGLLKSSSRLDVILKDAPGAFEEVSRLINEAGVGIISVGLQEGEAGRKLYFFRLEKCEVAPIAKSLMQHGHRVVAALD